MEATPEKLSSAQSTSPLPVGTSGAISGSMPSVLPNANRQTSGVGGFHLSKLEGNATARLNVEASWFDTTMFNAFNPARATKAEIEAYEAAKASINPTLGSPVTRYRIDGHARNDLEAFKPFNLSPIAREALSGDRPLIVHPRPFKPIPNITEALNPETIIATGSQIGYNPVYASRTFDSGFSFAPGSAATTFTLPAPTKRRLYPFVSKSNNLQSVTSNVQSHPDQRSDSRPLTTFQGSFAIMNGNDSTNGHRLSKFTGDIKKETSTSKTDDGSIQRPSSALIIDPHRGPPEFQPGKMEHLNQISNLAIAKHSAMMPEVNQNFSTAAAYNTSANSYGKVGQTKYAYDSTPGSNHYADQNGKRPQFNQDYVSAEAYNTSMPHGGPLSHSQVVYQPNAQHAASGNSGGLVSSNTQYDPYSVAYTAPANPGQPVTQFKQPYPPHATNGHPGKQNALLDEVNRALGAPHAYATPMGHNANTVQTGQFYRPSLAYGAPVAQNYASVEPLSNLSYTSHGGYNISESREGGMRQPPGSSGSPRSYSTAGNQAVGMQNFNQHASSIGRYPVHGDQTREFTVNNQPRAIVSVNQGYGLSTVYSQSELQGGGIGQANQLNHSSPSATYATGGSQAGTFRSGLVTVDPSESFKNTPERAAKSKELQTPRTQTPDRPLVLKNYFNHNPFGPISPPSGPIKLPPESPYNISPHLASIAQNGKKPHVDWALDSANLPFVDLGRNIRIYNRGVLRIMNIPWGVSRAEILAFLGRNAQVKEAEEPVHIILDRFSGKTIEAYVEFEDLGEVMNAVSRYQHNKEQGRSGRLGDRHAALEVSSQEALMKALFPKTRNVTWNGCLANIKPKDPNDIYDSGFRGFLTNEELLLVTKCVEQPHRTPYGINCPQRPYETLISLLKKYPWSMVDFITLEDRDLLFYTARKLTEELYKHVLEDSQHIDLNQRLLRRFQLVVLKCPGFTEAQKDDICYICNLNPSVEGLAPYAEHWFALKAIGPKPGVASDVLQYYMALLREATTLPGKATLAERAANETKFPIVFGNMGIEYPANVQQMTLAQVARIEWSVIEKLLRKSLEG